MPGDSFLLQRKGLVWFMYEQMDSPCRRSVARACGGIAEGKRVRSQCQGPLLQDLCCKTKMRERTPAEQTESRENVPKKGQAPKGAISLNGM